MNEMGLRNPWEEKGEEKANRENKDGGNVTSILSCIPVFDRGARET